VEIILQMGALDLETNSTLALFAHLIREPAFNQLRTEEQLGYIVHSSIKTSGDHIKGLLILIQSDSFNPYHVEERIEIFLASFRQRIVEMSESDFQTFVDTVVASFLEKVRPFVWTVFCVFKFLLESRLSFLYFHISPNLSFACSIESEQKSRRGIFPVLARYFKQNVRFLAVSKDCRSREEAHKNTSPAILR
jgi:hypothetical protein